MQFLYFNIDRAVLKPSSLNRNLTDFSKNQYKYEALGRVLN